MKRETSDIEWSLPRQCKAVVVHDDSETKRRAKELWDTILNDMGRDAQSGVTYLSAEQIEKAPVCEHAAQIDVVIISMHDLARFLSNVAGWLADWLNADTCLPRALFILHDGEEDRQLLNFLRTLAEFAGVTMFSCSRETDCVWHGGHSERSRHIAEMVAAIA
ncbi:MAG: hypothetical protein HZC54_15520 [Verrucomicrobia bacterium]|nr:hypothetical protein [Verrucomicrobiota bacterium]